MNTGAQIVHRRSLLGLSQSDLARRLNISPQHVFKWEKGIVQPSATNLRKLATALKCKIDDLF